MAKEKNSANGARYVRVVGLSAKRVTAAIQSIDASKQRQNGACGLCSRGNIGHVSTQIAHMANNSNESM
jgi:hypothetical protein